MDGIQLSRQFEEESEEFVLLHSVWKVEMAERRNEVNQVASGYDYACLFFLGEVVDVLLEGLEIG